jgi:hypothetical protein
MKNELQTTYNNLLNKGSFLIQIPNRDNSEWYEVFQLKDKFFECEVLANGKCIKITTHNGKPKVFDTLYNSELNAKKF